MRKTYFSTVLFCLIITVSSCDKNEPMNLHKEQEKIANTNDYINAYTSLIFNLKTTIRANTEDISQSSDIEYLSHKVYEDLSEKEKDILHNFALPSNNLRTESDENLDKILEQALLFIEPYIYTENSDELIDAIEEFYHQELYTRLSDEEKNIIKESFELIDDLRLEVINTFNKEVECSTRMSPGDRMIWSESVKEMKECQRDAASRMTIKSISASLGAKGFFGTLKSVAKDVYDYVTC